MVDQSKVTSGFDVEFLMSEEFIHYFLLCSMETGSIPWWSESSGIDENGTPFHRATITHPPSELEQRRRADEEYRRTGRREPVPAGRGD
jgi:hypothetical protein